MQSQVGAALRHNASTHLGHQHGRRSISNQSCSCLGICLSLVHVMASGTAGAGSMQSASETNGTATLAFGFSKSKATKRVAVNVEDKVEERTLLSGVEGAKLRAAAGEASASARQYVIPRIENTYKTGVGATVTTAPDGTKRFAPTFRPPTDDAVPGAKPGEDRFVAAAAPMASTITEYGLVRRDAAAKAASAALLEGQQEQATGTVNGHGQQQGSITARLTAAQAEDAAFKEDMETLPDIASLEAYEAMPIEEFGKAMLRGMGWQEGMGVGRNRRVVDAIEYLKRPERLGLGAQPAPMVADMKPKVVKMGDAPAGAARREDFVLPVDADGRQRHVRKLDEKLVARKDVLPGPQLGKAMCVTGGRHEGLLCSVVALLLMEEGRSDRASVRLTASDAIVEVRCKDLAELWEKRELAEGQTDGRDNQAAAKRERGGKSKDDDRPSTAANGDGKRRKGEHDQRRDATVDDAWDDEPVQQQAGPNDRSNKRSKGSSRNRDDTGTVAGRDFSAPSTDRKGVPLLPGRSGLGREGSRIEREPPCWLLPHIRVRIIDKAVRSGKLYLKKGTVLDVHPGAVADVAVDGLSRGDVLHMQQSALETVVPKVAGAAVMVLAGPHRGQRAKLLKADMERGAAAVQLVSDLSVDRLLLDELAEYAGALDDD